MSNQFKKEEPREKKNGVINIDLGSSVLAYIKQLFSLNKNKSSINILFKQNFSSNIKIDDFSYPVVFTLYEVVKNTYLDIQFTGKSKAQAIKCLEYIHNKLRQSNIHNDYIMIVSYDSISEYYCNKIYPKLNKLERNLRKLLFNIYVVNFGRECYQATTSYELQCKIKERIKAKGNDEKKEIERLQKSFYSMEFIDIKNLLFTERWTSVEEKAKSDFLERNNELTELSEEELRNAFDRFTPKSDWERFFNNKISDVDVQSLLEIIRVNRNDIAHCKFFYKEQYNITSNAIRTLNKAILTAINLTEEKDFVDKNNEAMKSSLASISNLLKDFADKNNETMKSSLASISNSLKYFQDELTKSTKPIAASISEIFQVTSPITGIANKANQFTKINNIGLMSNIKPLLTDLVSFTPSYLTDDENIQDEEITESEEDNNA